MRTKTVAWAKGARAARERTRREENIVVFFGVNRRSGREKESGRADGDGLNWQSTGGCKSQEKKKKKGTEAIYARNGIIHGRLFETARQLGLTEPNGEHPSLSQSRSACLCILQ